MDKKITLSEIIGELHRVSKSQNEKDVLINNMYSILNDVEDLFKDPQFMTTDIYQYLKSKFYVKIHEKIGKLQKVEINPVYIPTTKDLIKPKKKKIIVNEVTAPINFDIYESPKFKPKLIYTKKLPYIQCRYEGIMYKLNTESCKLYTIDDKYCGYISNNNVVIYTERGQINIILKTCNIKEINYNYIKISRQYYYK